MPTSRRNFLTTAAGIAAGGAAMALAAVPASAVSSPMLDGDLRQAFGDIVEIYAARDRMHKKYGDAADSRMITKNLRTGWTTPLKP